MADGEQTTTWERNPRGRPPHVPTKKDREIASFGAAMGIDQVVIGKLIGIGKSTLQTHYREELELGMARANVSVGSNLYKIATGNSPQAATAAMFWLKMRCGWKETDRGADDAPIETVFRIIGGLPPPPKALTVEKELPMPYPLDEEETVDAG